MPTKEEIIDNIGEYTIAQLAEYIRKGKLEREDLNVPSFSASKRKELDQFLSQQPSTPQSDPKTDDDEAMWTSAKNDDTINAYSNYLKQTDNKGAHIDEARQRIKELSSASTTPESTPYTCDIDNPWGPSKYEELIDYLSNRPIPSDNEVVKRVHEYVTEFGKETFQRKIVQEIKKNPNLLSAGVIKKLFKDNILNKEQLDDLFPKDFLKAAWGNQKSPIISPFSGTLRTLPTPCTEVYFWGISQSGKSCLLASLLSVVKSGKYGSWSPKGESIGYEYMMKLADVMCPDKVTPVAPRTPLGAIYDMCFDFTTKETNTKRRFSIGSTERNTHPIAFIDLAGGMLNIMYKFIAQPKTLSKEDVENLSNMTNVIKGNLGKNRKMHFFILEYGADNYESIEGVSQDTLLMTAAKFIEDENIFTKDTDAIYFVITKADKAGLHNEELSKELNSYIQNHYLGFYNKLHQICKKNSISFGVIPYTIGTVMMQSYCKLDTKAATNVLSKIVGRTFYIDESLLGKTKQKLQN